MKKPLMSPRTFYILAFVVSLSAQLFLAIASALFVMGTAMILGRVITPEEMDGLGFYLYLLPSIQLIISALLTICFLRKVRLYYLALNLLFIPGFVAFWLYVLKIK